MTSETSATEPDEIASDGDVATPEFRRTQSKKTEVLEILFEVLCPTGKLGAERTIASSDQVVAAIEARNKLHPGEDKHLSTKNVANFLKDLIRIGSCNDNWPGALRAKKITARQVYGKKQVLEFVPYGAGDTVPFPDRYDPTDDMPTLPFETLSIPFEARQLGRRDEPWLIQVSVSQHIVHAHFAIHAAKEGLNVETLSHLQTSVKTQPEIDATFIASIRENDGTRCRAYVTVEAKQIRERILEHQIREQVAQAFKFTAKLKGENAIDAVLPLAIKVVDHKGERGIYVAQFHPIQRSAFDETFKVPEHLHEMPLTVQSRSFFAPHPNVQGISR